MLAGTVWVFPFRFPLSKIRSANNFSLVRENLWGHRICLVSLVVLILILRWIARGVALLWGC